jgi:hypothetical protein
MINKREFSKKWSVRVICCSYAFVCAAQDMFSFNSQKAAEDGVTNSVQI